MRSVESSAIFIMVIDTLTDSYNFLNSIGPCKPRSCKCAARDCASPSPTWPRLQRTPGSRPPPATPPTDEFKFFANFWPARYRLHQNENFKKTCVCQHFSRSTRFAYFCTAAISKFSQKIGLENNNSREISAKKVANVAKFANFCQISKISA